MRIVEPYARMMGILNPAGSFSSIDGIRMLQCIEYYARVSHASEDSITPDSWDRFLRSVVMTHGDLSVIEHEKVTCEILVDRGITHEIVRHRIGSYTQESTRFINYQKKGGECKFIWPIETGLKAEVDGLSYDNNMVWEGAMEAAEKAYLDLLKGGIKPQIARGVLPNSLASKIIVTYNLRGWRHFFLMRTSLETHPQMKQVTIPLLKEFQRCIPILFEDIISDRRQADNMRQLR